jgi:hypothetical protein
MKSKQNKKRGNISRAKKPKMVDLFDNAELSTSPFHKMKTGAYLNKKGEWKNYAIFRKKTHDELFNEEGVFSKKEEQNPSPIQNTEMSEKKQIKTKKRNCLITRNEQTGDFYYKNKPIEFKGKNTIYFWIFECLYEKSDLEGFCSYENIDKYLIEHGKEECEDWRQVMNRIKNGITNLFRYSNLPKKTPNNKDLIQKTRGEGLTLYNP